MIIAAIYYFEVLKITSTIVQIPGTNGPNINRMSFQNSEPLANNDTLEVAHV